MNPQRKGSLYSTCLLLITALIFSGCAPRVGSSAASSGSGAYINLPAIVVQYAEDGEASLFGMPVSELGELLGGADLSALSFEAETISNMVDSGIEHIQIDNQPGGIRLYRNSQPLPGLVWDDEVRAGLGETIEMLAEDAGPIAPLLPLLPDMGVGLALKMPGAEDASLEISNAQVLTVEDAESILSSVRTTQPTMVLEITYAEDGSFETGQLPFVLQFAPIPWDQLELPADTLTSITDMGIESLSVTLLADGLAIKVNGNDMPFLQWSNQSEFSNLLGMLPVLLGPDSGIEGMLGMMPILMGVATGMNISITFPTATQ